MLTWIIELSVSENWIEDGFNPDDLRIEDALSNLLPYAVEGVELKARIIKKPSLEKIKKLQQG